MSLQKLLQIILCRNLKNMAARTKKRSFFGHSQKKKQKLRFLALAAIFLRFWQKKKFEQLHGSFRATFVRDILL